MPLGKASVLLVQILKLLCKEKVTQHTRFITLCCTCFLVLVKKKRERKRNKSHRYLIIWPFSPLKTPNKVGALWTEAGLNWNDFLPKDEDVNKFVTDQVRATRSGFRR